MDEQKIDLSQLNWYAFISYMVCIICAAGTFMIAIANPTMPNEIKNAALLLAVIGLAVYAVNTYLQFLYEYSASRFGALFFIVAQGVLIIHPISHYAYVSIILLIGSLVTFWFLNFTDWAHRPKRKKTTMSDNT